MSYQRSTFPVELGIASRVGLTRGAGTGLTSTGVGSFAEAEMHYRQDRAIADLRRHRQTGAAGSGRSGRSGRRGVSRWTTWLPSVPRFRSSPARLSSSACER